MGLQLVLFVFSKARISANKLLSTRPRQTQVFCLTKQQVWEHLRDPASSWEVSHFGNLYKEAEEPQSKLTFVSSGSSFLAPRGFHEEVTLVVIGIQQNSKSRGKGSCI